MQRKQIVTWSLVSIFFVYVAYSGVTETGLVAFINYAQQSLFGSYREKVTWLVILIVVTGFLFSLRAIVNRFFGGDKSGMIDQLLYGAYRQSIPSSTKFVPSLKVYLQIATLVVVATWLVAAGLYWYGDQREQQDATANYEPINLSDGAPTHQPKGSHIALQGEVLSDFTVVKTNGGDRPADIDYTFVPIAPRGWEPGQAVTFVLKVRTVADIPRPIPTPRTSEPVNAAADDTTLRVRITDTVPFIATQEFEKMGIPIGEPSYVLTLVRTQYAGPHYAGDDYSIYYLGGGLAFSVLVFLIFGLVGYLVARKARMQV